ncbi:podocalyxin-like protein 2 isoform X3 [Synchiropus splendidus]|uniref:podocalyxin-like protein 2 isoform X3 n=1 Tax=Synchiropus splendidus TaxID=270530 RepID=UPI00237E9AF6|nr:podocalyxin-like protein 2 isoform X3 [Synchiropus splendidus]
MQQINAERRIARSHRRSADTTAGSRAIPTDFPLGQRAAEPAGVQQGRNQPQSRGGTMKTAAAAEMSGLRFFALTALLICGEASIQESGPDPTPLSQFQDEGLARSYLIQELIRIKRGSAADLVRVQPQQVHDLSWSAIHEMETANLTQSPRGSEAVDDNLNVKDEMERMVHLVLPQDAAVYRRQPDSSGAETSIVARPGAGYSSVESSGFFGTDTEERDRAEERERRAGEDEAEDEWEREPEDRGGREGQLEGNHTTPDFDDLIGYRPHLPSKSPINSSPAEVHKPGLQELHRPQLLQVSVDSDQWGAAVGKDEAHSSGDGVFRSFGTATLPSLVSASASDVKATLNPETDTGTDFGLMDTYTEAEWKNAPSRHPTVAGAAVSPNRDPLQPSVDRFGEVRLDDDEEEEKWRKIERERYLRTTNEPYFRFSGAPWDWPETVTPVQASRPETQGHGVTELYFPVICVNWSELAGRGYVVLNLTENFNCEEFRLDQGVRLLKILEHKFARRMNSPEGSWALFLSKPTHLQHQQHQLLMNVLASRHGIIETKDALEMLEEVRKSLNQIGIESYSSASSCTSRLTKTRSDYGKLFVVLVIIGSVCMVIITSGFIYICWQRRLPSSKTTMPKLRAEELHYMENGCHDNPTLDIGNNNQPEMQEKKPSANGHAGGGDRGGEEGCHWQGFVNQAVTEEDEEEEQDTHL